MKRIAVAYLCRYYNPPHVSRDFLKSLLRFRAGAEFDLVYILKGFPDGQTDPALSQMKATLPWAVQEARVSDDFLMLNGLLDGAAQISHEYFLPLGSWSRILAHDWLGSLVHAYDRVPGCVVAGRNGQFWLGHPRNTVSEHPHPHHRFPDES